MKAFINNNKKVCEIIKNYFINLFSDKKAFFIVLYTIISYGFSLFTRTVSVDDLAKDLYVGQGKYMLVGMRWFFYVWNRLFSTICYTPFLDEIIAFVFLIMATIVIGSIFEYITKNRNNTWPFVIFSVFFINYPLINEIWEYSGTCTAIYGGLALSSYSILYYLVSEERRSVIDYIFMGLLITPSMASYESVVFVYIELVLMVLYLKTKNNNKYNWFMNGFKLAIPLIIAFVVRLVVGYGIISVMGLDYSPSGNSHLYWSQGTLSEGIRLIIDSNIEAYFSKRYYLPILEFVIAFVLYCIIVVINCIKNWKTLPLAVLIVLSIFTLSIIQASLLPYRTAQTVQLFVAFVYYMFIDNLNSYSKSIKITVVILFLFLGLRSSIYMHNLLALNNQRSENEAAVIRNIGQRLYTEFDSNKTVIFCGNYDMGNFIESQVEGLVQTNVQSAIDWSIIAFESQDMMKEYFSYYGFDIKTTDMYFDYQTNQKYEKIARDNNMKPLDIKDMGDYILVFFG